MKTILKTALLSAGSTLALVSAASAAVTIDASPVINEAITDIVQPVALAVIPVIGSLIVMPLRRFLDQKAGDLLASRVDDLLDKAVAFAAKQGESWVAEKDFHVNVDGWLAGIAADYAVQHAPTLMKKAGALAAAKASDVAKQAADDLLKQKVVARLAAHPAVQALKAKVPTAIVAKAA